MFHFQKALKGTLSHFNLLTCPKFVLTDMEEILLRISVLAPIVDGKKFETS
jgi:hypothetical protein